MVDTINEAIREMCKAHPSGKPGMAAALGMSVDVFNNHAYRKCGSRFFTLDELELMQELSGTAFFAEYSASRVKRLLVDIPSLDDLDNVCLYQNEMKIAVAQGEFSIAKIQAIADGVVDRHESRDITNKFKSYLRYSMQGFFGFMALNGVVDHAVDTFVCQRKSDARECAAPGVVANESFVEN